MPATRHAARIAPTGRRSARCLPPPPARDPELAAAGWSVPAGRPLELAGRGTTFIREAPGPSPDAPTVFLLHGLSATGGVNWYSAFSTLAEHFRVVAIDHRGHGRGIRSERRFRLADCADDVVAAADVLGIDRFIPVGYSMGGPIAQLIWHRHHPRVEAMVLCATSRNFRGTPRERVQFAGLGLALAASWSGDRARGPVKALLSALVNPSVDNEPLRRWMTAEMARSDIRVVLEAAEAIGRYSSHDWISHIDVPVSVVVPSQDRLVPVRRQLKLARQIPTAVLFPVEGDHLVAGTQPENFVPALMEATLLAARRARRGAPALAPLR